MSHDKIRAAARKRMAETGEPYATARREAIKNYQAAAAGASSSSARWFAISYSDMDRVSLWLETLRGRGSGRWGVEVDSAVLRVRMAGMSIPRRLADPKSVATLRVPSPGGGSGYPAGDLRWWCGVLVGND